MATLTPKENEIKEDKLVKAIGEFGKWQIFMIVITTVPLKLPLPWIHFGIVILAGKTNFWCLERENSTEEIKNGTCYSDCIKYGYYSEFENTIISEWDLICERAWLANFTQMILMFGVVIGGIVFGFLSDRYGRRTVLLISSTLQLCTNFLEAFSPNYWSFTLIRFFLGASTAGTMLTFFVFLVEIVGPGKREILNVFIGASLGIGQMLMCLFSYYLRSWDKYSFGIAIPNLIFLIYIFILPESPKWLISMGKLEEASKVMINAAKWNKLPKADMLKIAEDKYKELNSENDESKRANYLDLILVPMSRTRIVCSCLIWFALGSSLYGCVQYIGQQSANVHINFIVMGAAVFAGTVVGAYFCKLLGRRITIISSSIAGAIANAMLVLPEDWFYTKIVAGVLGYGFNACAYSSMYIYTSELFPTVVRNKAISASSMASKIGCTLSPLIAGMGAASWVPSAVFGTLPLISAAACLYLPETKGIQLTDYLNE